MRSRAERRHHHERMLNKVKTFSLYQSYRWSEEDKLEHQRRMAENRKPCSCHMCCNPRHSAWYKGKGKLTMQEKRAFQKEEDIDAS